MQEACEGMKNGKRRKRRGNYRLSNSNLKVLEFILNYQDRFGYPPSMKEIAKKFGYSSAEVARWHIDRLARHGMIRQRKRKSRSVRIDYRKAMEAIHEAGEGGAGPSG